MYRYPLSIRQRCVNSQNCSSSVKQTPARNVMSLVLRFVYSVILPALASDVHSGISAVNIAHSNLTGHTPQIIPSIHSRCTTNLSSVYQGLTLLFVPNLFMTLSRNYEIVVVVVVYVYVVVRWREP